MVSRCGRDATGFLICGWRESLLRSDVTLLFGYRHGFFPLAKKGSLSKAKVVDHVRPQSDRAAYTALDAAYILPDLAPLAPDPWDPVSIKDAVENRLCVDMPPVPAGFIRDLRRFTRVFIRRHFRPVDLHTFAEKGDLFEWWISTRNSYTQERKDELRKLWNEDRQRRLKAKDEECVAFVKHETYEKPKWPRTIVSRSDAYKCFSGPFFALIEETAYTSAFFVKHVPVADRPDFISRLASANLRLFGSDWSSFEVHATAAIQRVVELPFYRYMLSGLPADSGAAEFLRTHERVATQDQKLRNKHTTFKIPACRMSGETCTSLGNGFTNLVLIHFVVARYGSRVIDMVVEGDDGLSAVLGPVPKEEFFRSCGCIVKLEEARDLSDAGFCSMYTVQTGDRTVMLRDFREKAVKFGWSSTPQAVVSAEARRSLLAGSGMSLAAECGSCPILYKIAECAIRDTAGASPKYDASAHWKQQQHTPTTRTCEPTMEVRSEYQRMFGIGIDDQLAIESEIERCRLRGPLLHLACYTPDRAKMATLIRVRRAGVPIADATNRDM